MGCKNSQCLDAAFPPFNYAAVGLACYSFGSSGTELRIIASFGDRVRIKNCPETLAAGVAGLEGDVYGFSTPSSTGVDVIGGAPDDYALNVSIDALEKDLWFRPDLVEFLHYNAGTEMVVGNVKAVRQIDGSWTETLINSQGSKKTPATRTRWTLLLETLKRLFTR